MAERQIGHRKSWLVLSKRFPVVNWRSRPVAKSYVLAVFSSARLDLWFDHLVSQLNCPPMLRSEEYHEINYSVLLKCTLYIIIQKKEMGFG